MRAGVNGQRTSNVRPLRFCWPHLGSDDTLLRHRHRLHPKGEPHGYGPRTPASYAG